MPHYNLTIYCHLQFYNESELIQSNQFETSWEKTKPPYYSITRDNTHGNAQCETIPFLYTSTSHTSTSSFNWTYQFISYRCTRLALMLSVHTYLYKSLSNGVEIKINVNCRKLMLVNGNNEQFQNSRMLLNLIEIRFDEKKNPCMSLWLLHYVIL